MNSPTYAEQLAIYDALIAQCTNFERKGKTMPYTSANTHMFSLLNKAGEIGIRLSKESGEAFMEKHNAEPYKSYGAFMRGYVKIPEEYWSDMPFMVALFEQGFTHAMSLKANPRKKK